MVDYMDVSPRMMVSVATAMIPFLQNDDANRALMGANMQRQAVPLLTTEPPIVATGIEHKAAVDSERLHARRRSRGAVDRRLRHRTSPSSMTTATYSTYHLTKFARSNQGTCINQRPIVAVGERVDSQAGHCRRPRYLQRRDRSGQERAHRLHDLGRLQLRGRHSAQRDDLVREDVFTSIHIEEYETEARDTKLGPEEITRDIPNVGEDALKDLDEHGIIRVGAEVRVRRYPGGQGHPQGRDRADRRGAAAAGHLRRKGKRSPGYLPEGAPRRIAASWWT